MNSVLSPEASQLHAELDRLATRVVVPEGHYLFHCGDPASGVYTIRKGAVTMELADASHLYPPRTLGPGEIVGLPATLTGSYSLSARVAEDAELGFIPAPRMTELLETSPRLCLLATRTISGEVARMRAALKEAQLDGH